MVRGGGGGREKNIVEINSQAFLEEYAKSSPDIRKELSSVAESSDGKIYGDDQDVSKVSKIVDHEKMKKHELKQSSIADSLGTGDVDLNGVPENTKISPTKTRLALSKRMSKFTKNSGKVSGTVGKFLLAKGIVQGIASGDTTGLAIMGARIGGEAAIEFVGKFGGKIAGKVAPKREPNLGLRPQLKLRLKDLVASPRLRDLLALWLILDYLYGD